MIMSTVVTDISKQALGILVGKILDQSRLLYTRKEKNTEDIKNNYTFALNLHIVKSFLDDTTAQKTSTSTTSALYNTITGELQKTLEDIYRDMSTINEIEQSNEQIFWFKSWRETPTMSLYDDLGVKYSRLLEVMELARKWLPISIINNKNDNL